MEEHLYSVLSNAVSFPVAWGNLGEGTSTPRAVVHRTSGSREWTLTGPGLMQARVQIDCYGATYAEAITASRAIRDEFDGYRGGPIQGAFLDTVRDTTADDAQLLHGVSMTFSVSYAE